MLLAQVNIPGLFQNMSWVQIGMLVFVGYMFLTGKIKIADILNLLNPVTPTPNPNPTPGPNPTPISTNLIQLLLTLLTKAQATGDKKLEEAVITVLPSCVENCTDPTHNYNK